MVERKEAKKVWVHVKATPAERDAWQSLAAAAGVTLADLMRQRMGGAAETKRKPVIRQRRMKAPDADPALLAAIAKAGNNLNQLGRWVNTHKSAADAAQVLIALAAIERQISSFLPPKAPADAGTGSEAD
jgi:hypothetical protein